MGDDLVVEAARELLELARDQDDDPAAAVAAALELVDQGLSPLTALEEVMEEYT